MAMVRILSRWLMIIVIQIDNTATLEASNVDVRVFGFVYRIDDAVMGSGASVDSITVCSQQ